VISTQECLWVDCILLSVSGLQAKCKDGQDIGVNLKIMHTEMFQFLATTEALAVIKATLGIVAGPNVY
jgi:hypothetical protein